MNPPGVPLESGFDYRPVEEFDALHLTSEQMAEWQAYLDDVKRSHLRAMASADRYVIGSAR